MQSIEVVITNKIERFVIINNILCIVKFGKTCNNTYAINPRHEKVLNMNVTKIYMFFIFKLIYFTLLVYINFFCFNRDKDFVKT